MAQFQCPFCGRSESSEALIMNHVDNQHSEGRHLHYTAGERCHDDATVDSLLAEQARMNYVDCPMDGCGEAILAEELNSHLDMHVVENEAGSVDGLDGVREGSFQDSDDVDDNSEENEAEDEKHDDRVSQRSSSKAPQPSSISQQSDREEKQEDAKAKWKKLMNMPNSSNSKVSSSSPLTSSSNKGPRRLGKAELGPHANEKQMPSWLLKLLEKDGEIKKVKRPDADGKMRTVDFSPNHTGGIMPVVAQLLEQDRETRIAFLCHPDVLHISKLWREGGFCGYRNIQMLSSFIVNTKSQGYPIFDGRIPTIFKIQDFIENAWDVGINSQGRIETGGVRGTRRYIGTPEAQAMFISLDIACGAQGIKSRDGQPAHVLLLKSVEDYFRAGYNGSRKDKIRRTHLPPLYFQHPGHSMTIVGLEKKKDGSTNLIVFDPMFGDRSGVTKLIGQTFRQKDPADLLKGYRRGSKYLMKYKEFEVLKLTPPSQ